MPTTGSGTNRTINFGKNVIADIKINSYTIQGNTLFNILLQEIYKILVSVKKTVP